MKTGCADTIAAAVLWTIIIAAIALLSTTIHVDVMKAFGFIADSIVLIMAVVVGVLVLSFFTARFFELIVPNHSISVEDGRSYVEHIEED